MSAIKSILAASGLIGAADAFVSSVGAPPRHAPSMLRGTTQTAVQSESSTMGSYPTLAVAATGITVLASFAGQRAKAGRRVTAIACNFDKTSQIGAMDPLGFFDPLDFCKDEASFKDLRGKELKHGRAAMMGAVGMLGQAVVQLPGMEDVPKDVSAAWTGNGAIGMGVTVAIIGLCEAVVFVQDEKKEPGNFGNPLPVLGDDYSDEMRSRELNNGRIAMFAAIGQLLAGLYTGKDSLQQFS